MKKEDVTLFGWSAEEADKVSGQANLSFEHGGHDMQPRTNDRDMLHLAAWLDPMDQRKGDAGLDSQPKLCGITPETVLEHSLLAPRLEKLYEKSRASNPTLPDTLEKFITDTNEGSGEQLHGERSCQMAGNSC